MIRQESKATEKQLYFITKIEKVTGKRFSGNTKREACEFIRNNIDEFLKMYQPCYDDPWAIANGYF